MGPDKRVTEIPGNGPSFCFKYPWFHGKSVTTKFIEADLSPEIAKVDAQGCVNAAGKMRQK